MQNKHLTHIEDLLILEGNSAIESIIQYLHAILHWLQGEKESIAITVKYDGSPAITFGKHPENKQFFISTKSLLNTKKVLYGYTHADIEQHFTPAIHQVLKDTFDILYAADHNAIWQGDVLYTPDTLITTHTHYEFRHNTLTYKVKKNSAMGNVIRQSPIGLAIHTQYSYKHEMYHAILGKTPPVLQGVWQPSLHPFYTIPISGYNAMQLLSAINRLALKATRLVDIHALLDSHFSNPKKWKEEIMKTINRRIKNGQSIEDTDAVWRDIHNTMWSFYIQQPSFDINNPQNGCARIDSFEKAHYRTIKQWFSWYADVIKVKHKIISVLENMIDYSELTIHLNEQLTHHEGFVVSHKDQWAVKLVRRNVFSQQNFINNQDRKKVKRGIRKKK